MTHRTRKIFALISTCIIATSLFGQDVNYQPGKIPPGLLRKDFLLLRDTMQKIQPSLYRYRSKAAIDIIFDSCFLAIRDSMTIPEFYAMTSFVIASIGDGHTNCKLSQQTMKDYMDNTKIFPAMVMFIHSKAYIYCCNQNQAIAGSELLSINNIPMNKIVGRLFNYIQSDAFIQSHKNWELPENFHLLYNVLYGITGNYNITYKTLSGETKKTTLQADTIKNVICPAPFSRSNKYLQLTYEPNNIAVLSIKTFFDGFLDQTGENFSKFLDSAFTDIKNKKAGKLLIDIRRNQGGNDGNGELLYSYLTTSSFMYYKRQETVHERFLARDHPNLAIQQPKSNNYKGKVYILADGRSFSASAEFSSIVKTNNRGQFIGEECGGGYYGNTSGDEAYVTLPNTQITARIPMVKYSMAVKNIHNKVRSIEPDYPVYSTISDIINKTDGQLYYAIKLVERL